MSQGGLESRMEVRSLCQMKTTKMIWTSHCRLSTARYSRTDDVPRGDHRRWGKRFSHRDERVSGSTGLERVRSWTRMTDFKHFPQILFSFAILLDFLGTLRRQRRLSVQLSLLFSFALFITHRLYAVFRVTLLCNLVVATPSASLGVYCSVFVSYIHRSCNQDDKRYQHWELMYRTQSPFSNLDEGFIGKVIQPRP